MKPNERSWRTFTLSGFKTMKITSLALASLVLSTSLVIPVTAMGQIKHKGLKSAAAGVAAYELAKHTGKNKKHKNFFQKHPVLTGVGAAALMHHHLKKKDKHH